MHSTAKVSGNKIQVETSHGTGIPTAGWKEKQASARFTGESTKKK
jgi:hypothetical protein